MSQQESMEDFSKEIENSFRKLQEGDVVTGTIIAFTDTEIIIDLGYYTQGIIKASDYSDDPSFSIKTDVPVGETISATVLALDDGEGNILLSKKEAAQMLSWDILNGYLQQGTVLSVKITGVVNGGVTTYVEGIRGFIPASKLDLNYVEDLEEWLHKTISVQVINVDKGANKLVLSAKELLKEQQKQEERRMISNVQVGLVTEGVVESLQSYGAFVRLSNGISGLLHISQISHRKIKHPKVVLKEGQKVTVKIIGIKEDKISLSMKALEDVSSEEIHEETINLPESEEISTNLGSLFKNIKL